MRWNLEMCKKVKKSKKSVASCTGGWACLGWEYKKNVKEVKKKCSQERTRNFQCLFFVVVVAFLLLFCICFSRVHFANAVLVLLFRHFFHNLVNAGFHGFCLRKTDLNAVDKTLQQVRLIFLALII